MTFEKFQQITENTPIALKVMTHLLENLNLKDVPTDIDHFMAAKRGIQKYEVN